MQTYRIFLFCLRFCQTFHIASYYFEVKTPLIVCTNFPKWFRFNLRFPHHKIRSTQNNTNLGFTWSYQISIMVTQYFGSTGFFFKKKLLRQLKHEMRNYLKILLFKKKKINCRYINYIEYIQLVKHLFLDSRGKVTQELICKRYLSQLYENWMGSFLMPDSCCSWPVCTFSCFVIIICEAELDQCWIGPREGRTG